MRALSAAEPSVCKYALTVETPEMCGLDLNGMYGHQPPPLRAPAPNDLIRLQPPFPNTVTAWLKPKAADTLRRYQDELYDEEITKQGYTKRVERLYMAAGFLPADAPPTTTTTTTTTTTPSPPPQKEAAAEGDQKPDVRDTDSGAAAVRRPVAGAT